MPTDNLNAPWWVLKALVCWTMITCWKSWCCVTKHMRESTASLRMWASWNYQFSSQNLKSYLCTQCSFASKDYIFWSHPRDLFLWIYVFHYGAQSNLQMSWEKKHCVVVSFLFLTCWGHIFMLLGLPRTALGYSPVQRP